MQFLRLCRPPTLKLPLLLLHNGLFASVMNSNVNICFQMVFGGCHPQVKNHCSRQILQTQWPRPKREGEPSTYVLPPGGSFILRPTVLKKNRACKTFLSSVTSSLGPGLQVSLRWGPLNILETSETQPFPTSWGLEANRI